MIQRLTAAFFALASVALAADDRELAVQSTNRVAVEMYRRMGAAPGNLCFSPYSISRAFAMLYGGSGGSTKLEIARAFGFPVEDEPVHRSFTAMRLDTAVGAPGSGPG